MQSFEAVTLTVHRLVERHAAINGDRVAIVDGESSCSYRELNRTANMLARRLMSAGFRRGMRAEVRMSPSVDLAVVLLAVLKIGGCYTWSSVDPDAGERHDFFPVSFRCAGGERRGLTIDQLTARGVAGGPNLPVVTRESDIACMLQQPGAPAPEAAGNVAVPHATITAMIAHAVPGRSPWMGESGAFDLWIALMTGATAVVNEHAAAAA